MTHTTWQSLGGIIIGQPGAVSRRQGYLDVFARGQNNALWHKALRGDEVLVEWEDLGGKITSGPVADSLGSDHLQVFVRGNDDAVYQKWWIEGTGWSEWYPHGGKIIGEPTAVSRGTDLTNLFVRGLNDHLFHKGYSAMYGWAEQWEDLGGVMTSSPTVMSDALDRLVIIIRGKDNALWFKSWIDAEGWSDWSALEGLGTNFTGGPSASSSANIGGVVNGRISVRGPNDHLNTTWTVFVPASKSFSWFKGWLDGGGIITSTPAVVTKHHWKVVARGKDGAVWLADDTPHA